MPGHVYFAIVPGMFMLRKIVFATLAVCAILPIAPGARAAIAPAGVFAGPVLGRQEAVQPAHYYYWHGRRYYHRRWVYRRGWRHGGYYRYY